MSATGADRRGEMRPLTRHQLRLLAQEVQRQPTHAQITKDLAAGVLDLLGPVMGDEAIKDVLVFADGLAVTHSGMALADLYAEDAEAPQAVLRWAGCHERGKDHPDLGTRNPMPNMSIPRSTRDGRSADA